MVNYVHRNEAYYLEYMYMRMYASTCYKTVFVVIQEVARGREIWFDVVEMSGFWALVHALLKERTWIKL